MSKTLVGPSACAEAGIDKLGITGPTTIYKNLTYQELFEHEVANKEGVVASAEYGDTFAVDTGKFTGRSPKDKWLVLNEGSDSAKHVDWNNINQATTPEVFQELYDKAVAHFNTLDRAYVFDCFVGASPKSQRKIRFVHEMAWPQHFVTNMFIRPESEEQLKDFEPDFTVINGKLVVASSTCMFWISCKKDVVLILSFLSVLLEIYQPARKWTKTGSATTYTRMSRLCSTSKRRRLSFSERGMGVRTRKESFLL